MQNFRILSSLNMETKRRLPSNAEAQIEAVEKMHQQDQHHLSQLAVRHALKTAISLGMR